MAIYAPNITGPSKNSCCIGLGVLCIVLLFVIIAHTFIVHPIYQHVMKPSKPTKFGHLASHLMNREKFSKVSTLVLFNVLKSNNFTVRCEPPNNVFVGKGRRVYFIKHGGVERALKTLLSVDGLSVKDSDMLRLFSRITIGMKILDCLETYVLTKCSNISRGDSRQWIIDHIFFDQALFQQAKLTLHQRGDTLVNEMINY